MNHKSLAVITLLLAHALFACSKKEMNTVADASANTQAKSASHGSPFSVQQYEDDKGRKVNGFFDSEGKLLFSLAGERLENTIELENGLTYYILNRSCARDDKKEEETGTCIHAISSRGDIYLGMSECESEPSSLHFKEVYTVPDFFTIHTLPPKVVKMRSDYPDPDGYCFEEFSEFVVSATVPPTWLIREAYVESFSEGYRIFAAINQRGEWVFGEPGKEHELETILYDDTYIAKYHDPDADSPQMCPRFKNPILCDVGLPWHCGSRFFHDPSFEYGDAWCEKNNDVSYCSAAMQVSLCNDSRLCFCPWNVQKCKDGDRRFCCDPQEDETHFEEGKQYYRKPDDGLNDEDIKKLYADAEKTYRCDAGERQHCTKDLARQRCEDGDWRFCESADATVRCKRGDARYCAKSAHKSDLWNAKTLCDAGSRTHCKSGVAAERCDAGDKRFCEDEIAHKRCKSGKVEFCKKLIVRSEKRPSEYDIRLVDRDSFHGGVNRDTFYGGCELYSLQSGKRLHSYDLTRCADMRDWKDKITFFPVATRDSGDSWGLMNLDGAMVVPPQFTEIAIDGNRFAMKLSRTDALAICGDYFSDPTISAFPFVCSAIGSMAPFIDREMLYGWIEPETGAIQWDDLAGRLWRRDSLCFYGSELLRFQKTDSTDPCTNYRKNTSQEGEMVKLVDKYRACVKTQRSLKSPPSEYDIQTLCAKDSEEMQGILAFCFRQYGWDKVVVEFEDTGFLDEDMCERVWGYHAEKPILDALLKDCESKNP
ncbi:MAG: hypothetical protein FWC40_00230 [Proteobacteria bacterium]|nr:hypothetical protein [Pseudomonadota bacterium]